MHTLLLIVYGGLASYAIWKMPFLRKSGIRPGWLWLLFVLHVITGWLHNWIAWHYFPEHGDIWDYFSKSFLYRHGLTSDLTWFAYGNSTWTYLTHNGIIFIQILLDLFSGDNMNINTLLFAFPVFIGNVALFRVFQRRFSVKTPSATLPPATTPTTTSTSSATHPFTGPYSPATPQAALPLPPPAPLAAACVFWLPSVLFWTSCIYREGMLFMLLGFLFFHLDKVFYSSPRPTRHIFSALILFLLIAYFRFAVAITLIPALLLWWTLQNPSPRRRLIIALSTILLLTLTLSIPALRDPALKVISTEQSLFQALDGHSRLPLPILDGTLASLIHTLPSAILNGFFGPLPGAGGQRIYLAFSLELLAVWAVAILALVHFLTRPFIHPTPGPRHPRHASPTPASPTALPSPQPPPSPNHTFPASAEPSPFPLACLLFALTGMLTVGLIVPFAGTIVRYRSIYLPFLLAPTLHTLRTVPLIQTLERLLTNKLRFFI